VHVLTTIYTVNGQGDFTVLLSALQQQPLHPHGVCIGLHCVNG